MSKQLQLVLAIVVAFAVVVGGVLFLAGRDDGSAADAGDQAADSTLVRSDSRVFAEGEDADVTFVEFLDFECEACGAAFPVVEQLRDEYAGQVRFVIRYFPLDAHFNAERAARAVEAAARQGKFEEMYQRMFETQSEWGEQRTPHDDLFASYAEDLGLDMEQFQADYESEEVAERVQRDVQDGLDLDVQGTPTFFVEGKRLEPQSVEDFNDALDAALADQ